MHRSIALALGVLSLAVGARAERDTVTVRVQQSASGMIDVETKDTVAEAAPQRPIARADVMLSCQGHEHHARTNTRGVATLPLHHRASGHVAGLRVSRAGFLGLSYEDSVDLPESGPLVVRLPAGGCCQAGCKTQASYAFARRR